MCVYMYVCVSISICVYMCVCVHVCVRERERKRECGCVCARAYGLCMRVLAYDVFVRVSLWVNVWEDSLPRFLCNTCTRACDLSYACIPNILSLSFSVSLSHAHRHTHTYAFVWCSSRCSIWHCAAVCNLS